MDAYFFENGGKKVSVVFKQKRIRVDGPESAMQTTSKILKTMRKRVSTF